MADMETARRMIDTGDCDILGHRNVNHYFVMVSDGGFGLQAAFGLGREAMLRTERLSFAVVHSEAEFLAEVLAGETVYQRSAILEIGTKSALFRHRQYRASDDRLVFEARFKCVLLHLDHRRAVAIPDAMRERMQPFLAAFP